jgi:hypothetical protein
MGCGTYYLLLVFVIFVVRNKHIRISETLLYIIVLFNFSASILGELFNFYYHFALWDNLLHCISGILLTILALNLLYAFNKEEDLKHLNYFTIFVFLIGFVAVISIGWELYEFFMDSFFNYNMQKSFFVTTSNFDFMQYVNSANIFVAPSLVDTMGDLLQGMLFAIITTILILLSGPQKIINKYIKKTF